MFSLERVLSRESLCGLEQLTESSWCPSTKSAQRPGPPRMHSNMGWVAARSMTTRCMQLFCLDHSRTHEGHLLAIAELQVLFITSFLLHTL